MVTFFDKGIGSKRFYQNMIPLIALIVLLLVGYFKVFMGGHFFVYQDYQIVSDNAYGNSLGNGWRADKGIGTSYFFGDPGTWHAWSPWVFWEKMFTSQKMSYSVSIVLFSFFVAVSFWYFLRCICPGLNNYWYIVFSFVLIFSNCQVGRFFCRNMIMVNGIIGLLILQLYAFLEQPRVKNLLLAVFLFALTFSVSIVYSFTELVSALLFFLVLYMVYFKKKIQLDVLFKRSIVFFCCSAVGTLFLGFWIFYANVLDYVVVGGYLREKVTAISFHMSLAPSLKNILSYMHGIFFVEWLPINLRMLGVWPHEQYLVALNVVSIFPIVFIYFLFKKAESFWEFVCKWMVFAFFMYQFLLLFPFFSSVTAVMSRFSITLISFYGIKALFVFEVALLCFFFKYGNIKTRDTFYSCKRQAFAVKAVSLILFCFYATVLIFYILLHFFPENSCFVFQRIIALALQHGLVHYPQKTLMYVIVSNLMLLREHFTVFSFLFFLTTLMLLWPFIIDTKRQASSRFLGKGVMFLLLLNALFYSWSMCPLNTHDNVWKDVQSKIPGIQAIDRFYFVNDKLGYGALDPEERLKRHKERVSEVGGLDKHLAYKVGIESPPYLNLSGHKSYIQKDAGNFLFNIFNGDGEKRIKELRELLQSGPLVHNVLMDLSAVSYFYSTREILDVPAYLSFVAKTEDLYIYRNSDAWPYYYLAQSVKKMDDVSFDVDGDFQKGDAYLNNDNMFFLHDHQEGAFVNLKTFSCGKMIFDYSGEYENLLVVSDAYHPFWKAKVGNDIFPVVPVNKVFKGIRLPAGSYKLELFFDTRPYLVGVYVALGAWFIFLFLCVWSMRNNVGADSR